MVGLDGFWIIYFGEEKEKGKRRSLWVMVDDKEGDFCS